MEIFIIILFVIIIIIYQQIMLKICNLKKNTITLQNIPLYSTQSILCASTFYEWRFDKNLPIHMLQTLKP
jgi:hypothetical protein